MRGIRLGPSASVAWALGMALALDCYGARAQSGPVDGLVSEGVQMRIQGRNSEAVERFRSAVELAPDSLRARGQLALALHAVGQWLESEQIMERVLAESDEWVDRHRAELEQSLRSVRSHLAWLQVDAQGPGTVWLDGHRVSSLPVRAPLRVVARRYLLEIHLSGHAPLRKEVDIAPGQRVLVDIATPPPPPAREQPEPAPTQLPSRANSERQNRESRARTYGLVLLGAGAAGLATGAAFGAYAIIARRQRDRECDADGCSIRGLQTDARGRQAATFSTLLFATGISSLVGGGVLLWQDQRGRTRVVLAPESTRGAGGVRLGVGW
ncbi:MAG: tetratricopeptide repeat protein [Polyangiaceae bacterium]|nr:tetratricopeptide repeat protein [Polyangiaceae bacterium]